MKQEFEQIVQENKSTIYTVCYMFSKDNDEINDLFQEVLINLWKGFPSFQGKSNVATWIWRVAFCSISTHGALYAKKIFFRVICVKSASFWNSFCHPMVHLVFVRIVRKLQR